MSSRWVFATVGLAALAAGLALWLATRPGGAPVDPPRIAPAALYAVSFRDANGQAHGLGQYQGRLLVLNFWATWCAPCREEMPAFNRLAERWKDRGVAFLGVSAEDPEPVARFGRSLGIGYPLATGGDAVGELSRRLGNRLGVLPHTVLVGPGGEVLETRVGPYSEAMLEERLRVFAPKRG